MLQKIIQIGNSIGVVIPKELARQTGVKAGSKIYMEKDHNGSTILISKNQKSFNSSITPDFLRIISNINKKYGPALQELANKNHD